MEFDRWGRWGSSNFQLDDHVRVHVVHVTTETQVWVERYPGAVVYKMKPPLLITEHMNKT